MRRLTDCDVTFLDPRRSSFKTDAGPADFDWPLVVEAFDSAVEARR
ncbi:MAG: hypothetical protein ACRDRN_19425 [Sciscionella sp.]